jgi:hypothetical protein
LLDSLSRSLSKLVNIYPCCSIDVTVCPIERPKKHQEQYYSAKHKCHALKYEIAVHLKTGLVIWVSGAYPGSMHDLTIAKTKFINILQNNEIALADKAYIGDFHFLTPFMNTRIYLF